MTDRRFESAKSSIAHPTLPAPHQGHLGEASPVRRKRDEKCG